MSCNYKSKEKEKYGSSELNRSLGGGGKFCNLSTLFCFDIVLNVMVLHRHIAWKGCDTLSHFFSFFFAAFSDNKVYPI